MTIKEVIKKSIEGGYNPKYGTTSDSLTFDREHWDFIFLDPQFWQCLGKAMGWDTDEWYYNNLVEGMERGKEWIEMWHRFIDHLISGKDPSSFFEQLN